MTSALNRAATAADLPAIARTYAHYVHETYATFDLEPPSTETWHARWEAAQRSGHPWLVAEVESAVVGYATTSPHRPKPAYDTTAEATIYLNASATGQGLGRPLYTATLRAAADRFHMVVAGIALPNEPSVALHEALGFTLVGTFAEVGRKLGAWRDVGWWQLRL